MTLPRLDTPARYRNHRTDQRRLTLPTTLSSPIGLTLPPLNKLATTSFNFLLPSSFPPSSTLPTTWIGRFLLQMYPRLPHQVTTPGKRRSQYDDASSPVLPLEYTRSIHDFYIPLSIASHTTNLYLIPFPIASILSLVPAFTSFPTNQSVPSHLFISLLVAISKSLSLCPELVVSISLFHYLLYNLNCYPLSVLLSYTLSLSLLSMLLLSVSYYSYIYLSLISLSDSHSKHSSLSSRGNIKST